MSYFERLTKGKSITDTINNNEPRTQTMDIKTFLEETQTPNEESVRKTPQIIKRQKSELEELAEYALLVDDVLGDDTIATDNEDSFREYNEKASILMKYWKEHKKK